MILESFSRPPDPEGMNTSKGYIFPKLDVMGAIINLGEGKMENIDAHKPDHFQEYMIPFSLT